MYSGMLGLNLAGISKVMQALYNPRLAVLSESLACMQATERIWLHRVPGHPGRRGCDVRNGPPADWGARNLGEAPTLHIVRWLRAEADFGQEVKAQIALLACD